MKAKAPWELLMSLFFLGMFFPLLTAADPIVYDGAGRRDPFVPLIGPGGIHSQKAERNDVEIEGIVYDPNSESMVLINGEFYKQGQKVANAVVISILQDRVVLFQNDEEKTFWMREEILPKGEKKNAAKKLLPKKN